MWEEGLSKKLIYLNWFLYTNSLQEISESTLSNIEKLQYLQDKGKMTLEQELLYYPIF